MRQSQFERLLQDVGDTKDGVDTILSTFLDRIVQTSNRVERIEADTERTLLWVEAEILAQDFLGLLSEEDEDELRSWLLKEFDAQRPQSSNAGSLSMFQKDRGEANAE